MRDKKNKFNTEVGEDATQYGEFIPSYFSWITLKGQKEKVEELESMTDNKDEKNGEK